MVEVRWQIPRRGTSADLGGAMRGAAYRLCFLFLGTNRRRCCFARGAQVHGIGVLAWLEPRYDADIQNLRVGAGDQQAAIGQFSSLEE